MCEQMMVVAKCTTYKSQKRSCMIPLQRRKEEEKLSNDGNIALQYNRSILSLCTKPISEICYFFSFHYK